MILPISEQRERECGQCLILELFHALSDFLITEHSPLYCQSLSKLSVKVLVKSTPIFVVTHSELNWNVAE